MRFRLSDVPDLPPYHHQVHIPHSHAEYRMAADSKQIFAVWLTAVSIFYPPSFDTIFEHQAMHNLLCAIPECPVGKYSRKNKSER